MPQKKRSALGRDPWDLVQPKGSQGSKSGPESKGSPAGRRSRGSQVSPEGQGAPGTLTPGEQRKQERKLQTYLDPALRERLNRAAYWERDTVAGIAERAIQRELDRLEKKRGSPYPKPSSASGSSS